MNANDHKVLSRLKRLLKCRLPVYEIVLFGSRARGDAAPDSDMDVLVVLNAPVTRQYRDTAMDCAWEVGFDADIVIVPVVVYHDAWKSRQQQDSLLALAIREEGIPV